MITISRTPLRISLCGGGTDLPAFYEKHGGAVISLAIDKYVYVILNNKFDGRYRVSYSRTENVESITKISHSLVRVALMKYGLVSVKGGLEIVSIADIPGEGSGLGSSSSFTSGLLNALSEKFEGAPYNQEFLASLSFDAEREVNPNIGKQDHWAAAYGGFRRYEFSPMGGVITKLVYPDNLRDESSLHPHMLLLWTGITRESKDLLQAQKENFASGNTVQIGKDMLQLVDECHKHILEGNIQEVARDVHSGWHMKRRLAPGIDNDWINLMYQKAIMAGAWGGKLCGAGGGGFLFFIAPPDTHKGIVQATGLRKVDFSIDYEGSVIVKREGHGEF